MIRSAISVLLVSMALAAGEGPQTIAIADRAIATLNVPGYPDLLAVDGEDVWVTNENRVEKLGLRA